MLHLIRCGKDKRRRSRQTCRRVVSKSGDQSFQFEFVSGRLGFSERKTIQNSIAIIGSDPRALIDHAPATILLQPQSEAHTVLIPYSGEKLRSAEFVQCTSSDWLEQKHLADGRTGMIEFRKLNAVMKNPIDVHLGQRLEALRLEQGKTLQTVASKLDITYQQVRKYENGENRISASTLYRLSRMMDVQPSFFFEGVESKPDLELGVDPQPVLEADYEEVLGRVKDEDVRKALRHLFVQMEKLGPGYRRG